MNLICALLLIGAWTGSTATTCAPGRFPELPRLDARTATQRQIVDKIEAGEIFVLSNLSAAGFSPALFEWGSSCSSLAANPDFNDVLVRQEYSQSATTKRWLTLQQLIDAVAQRRLTPDSPFYWAIREPETAGPEERQMDPESSVTWDERRFELVQRLVQHSRLFPKEMLENLRRRPEVWISFANAGAQTHMDGHTDATISIQLSGRKLWTVSELPHRAGAHAVEQIYGDGMCSTRGECPTKRSRQAVLTPGDAILFPPGTLHETCGQNSTELEEAGGCGLSITCEGHPVECSLIS